MPELLPLFPLGTVLFPGMALPLHIFEERYRTMFARRAGDDPMFGVVLTQSGREVGDQPDVHAVGTAASLIKAVRYVDGRVDLAVRGGRRFRMLGGHWDEGYLTGTIEWLADDAVSEPAGADAARLADRLSAAFGAYLAVLARIADVRVEQPELGLDPLTSAYAVAAMMPFDTAQRQRLLEAATPLPLLADLLAAIDRERELLLATGIGGAAFDHPGRRFSTN